MVADSFITFPKLPVKVRLPFPFEIMDSINKISISVKASGTTSSSVDFDGIRINDNDTYVQETGIISRAVLSTPIIKEFGRVLDLEYRLVIQ